MFTVFACKDAGNPPPAEESASPGTFFWAQKVQQGDTGWYQVPATLRAEGTYSKVYVENANSAVVTDALAASIAAEFDANVFIDISSTFGSTGDFNGDGKVTLLILDIIDDYDTSGGYVAGYFHSGNEYSRDSFPYSNEQEMLYMDLNPGDPGDPDFNQTMAHELQHLINFYQNVFVQSPSGVMDTWIDEGLSSAAEYVYRDSHVQWKIDVYNNPGPIQTDIGNGKNFVKWEGLLANYSTVYLFFQWLRIQASNKTGIYREILDGPGNDYTAVETAASARIYVGTTPWQQVIRDWLAANQLSSTGTSLAPYNYGGEISLNPPLNDGGAALTLAPGEGVYVAIAGSNDQTPNAVINYAGIDTSTDVVDSTATLDSLYTYSGDILLSYNSVPDPLGSSGTTGTLPSASILPPDDQTVSLASRSLVPGEGKRYPIDAVLHPEGPLPAGR